MSCTGVTFSRTPVAKERDTTRSKHKTQSQDETNATVDQHLKLRAVSHVLMMDIRAGLVSWSSLTADVHLQRGSLDKGHIADGPVGGGN